MTALQLSQKSKHNYSRRQRRRLVLRTFVDESWFQACAGTHRLVQGLPAIMLSEAALALIRDVFERPDLFHAAPRITRRVVKWGRNAEPLALDHAAVVVSERELLGELEQELWNRSVNRPGRSKPLYDLCVPSVAAGTGRTLLRFANRFGCECAPEGRARFDILLDRISRRWVAVFDPECG